MTDKDVEDIIYKIKNLRSGESCVYYRGKTRWMEDIKQPKALKKLQDFFEAAHSRNYYYFTSRRLTADKISEYEYIATKSRKIR